MENDTWLFDKSFIYHFDSNDKLDGEQQDCNIKMELPNANIRDFDSVVVLSASVPKSYYAIHNPHREFYLTKTILGLTFSYTITLDEGTYSATEMVNELQDKITTKISGDNEISNFVVSVDLNKGKFVFNCDVSADATISLVFDQFEIGRRLGFDLGTFIFSGSGSGNRNLISRDVMDMSPENDVYIRSNMVAGGINANEDILIDLQGSGIPPFGRIQFYNPEPNHYTKTLNNTTEIFNFRITDENGEVLDLNGKNWTMTVLFYKKSKLPSMIKDTIRLIVDMF